MVQKPKTTLELSAEPIRMSSYQMNSVIHVTFWFEFLMQRSNITSVKRSDIEPFFINLLYYRTSFPLVSQLQGIAIASKGGAARLDGGLLGCRCIAEKRHQTRRQFNLCERDESSGLARVKPPVCTLFRYCLILLVTWIFHGSGSEIHRVIGSQYTSMQVWFC